MTCRPYNKYESKKNNARLTHVLNHRGDNKNRKVILMFTKYCGITIARVFDELQIEFRFFNDFSSPFRMMSKYSLETNAEKIRTTAPSPVYVRKRRN